MSIEAMKQAIETLELANYQICDYCGTTLDEIEEAITALRTAIEQTEKQEPYLKRELKLLRQEKFELINQRNILQKRIAKLEQAEKQQPLTDEEIEFIYADTGYNDIQMFARAIEAAHGIMSVPDGKGEA